MEQAGNKQRKRVELKMLPSVCGWREDRRKLCTRAKGNMDKHNFDFIPH